MELMYFELSKKAEGCSHGGRPRYFCTPGHVNELCNGSDEPTVGPGGRRQS